MQNDDHEEKVEVEEEGKVEEPKEEPTEPEEDEEGKDWKAEAKKWRAEAFKLKGTPNSSKAPNKSNDFGYDVKAYLKASGIDAAEFDFVKQEMKEAGIKDVDSLLENKYFQSRLEEHREISRTQEATPTGRRTSGVATDSVDYWLSKPIEEVPKEKRREVVKAKRERESNKGKFYNS